MKLSKRSAYGLKALIELAVYYGRGVVTVPQMAQKHHISAKFLELILLDLRHAGVVHSRQGVHGEYYLAAPPEQITIPTCRRCTGGRHSPRA
jgi:Rrf2 family protein